MAKIETYEQLSALFTLLTLDDIKADDWEIANNVQEEY